MIKKLSCLLMVCIGVMATYKTLILGLVMIQIGIKYFWIVEDLKNGL